MAGALYLRRASLRLDRSPATGGRARDCRLPGGRRARDRCHGMALLTAAASRHSAGCGKTASLFDRTHALLRAAARRPPRLLGSAEQSGQLSSQIGGERWSVTDRSADDMSGLGDGAADDTLNRLVPIGGPNLVDTGEKETHHLADNAAGRRHFAQIHKLLGYRTDFLEKLAPGIGFEALGLASDPA